MPNNGFSDKAAFIWRVADLLRSSNHPNQCKDVMLPEWRQEDENNNQDN